MFVRRCSRLFNGFNGFQSLFNSLSKVAHGASKLVQRFSRVSPGFFEGFSMVLEGLSMVSMIFDGSSIVSMVLQ